MFDKEQPLWLPKGSVRALVTFAILGAAFIGVEEAWPLAATAFGFYFGSRTK